MSLYLKPYIQFNANLFTWMEINPDSSVLCLHETLGSDLECFFSDIQVTELEREEADAVCFSWGFSRESFLF